jgi:hypothetical protein
MEFQCRAEPDFDCSYYFLIKKYSGASPINLNGSLAGIGLASAQTVINDASFGNSAQQLLPLAGLQTGAARLG